jgi:HTH-type transcriptional regulator/antitoxin HigA
MENKMNSQLENIEKIWPTIKSIFSVPHSENEYNALVEILDSLIDEVGNNQEHKLAPVMETIGNLIENYEDQKYKIKEASPVDTLKFLMKEHDLNQSDLKEIGSQGVVSEILTGKRTLNIDQIKKISNKFNVSPLVFI